MAQHPAPPDRLRATETALPVPCGPTGMPDGFGCCGVRCPATKTRRRPDTYRRVPDVRPTPRRSLLHFQTYRPDAVSDEPRLGWTGHGIHAWRGLRQSG